MLGISTCNYNHFFHSYIFAGTKKKRFWSVLLPLSLHSLWLPHRHHAPIHLPRGAESLVSLAFLLAFFTFLLYMNFFELPNIPPYHETLQLDDLRSLPPSPPPPPLFPQRPRTLLHALHKYVQNGSLVRFPILRSLPHPPGPSGRHACMCYCRPTAYPQRSRRPRTCPVSNKKKVPYFSPYFRAWPLPLSSHIEKDKEWNRVDI